MSKFDLHFWLINIYDPTSMLDMKNLWDELTRKISLNHSEKIILAGDFNAITSLSEKRGGVCPPSRVISDFSQFITTNTLRDVYSILGNFTWTCRH